MARKSNAATAEATETASATSAAEAPPEGGRMRRIRYEFVLEAALPIAHASENLGNESLIMRQKVRTRGAWAEVPIVTGDTMRHGLREAAAYALLDAAGMLESRSLSEAALRLLFAGGMVTGKGDASSVRIDDYREMCELVPSLALLGGCAQNRVIPGRLNVEPAMLICAETRGYVPAWAVQFSEEYFGALDSHRAHVEEQQRVRMDPMLVPEKRLLLSADAQVAANNRLLASETASASGDAVEKDAAKSTMMPRKFERVAQGSLFFWAVEATTYSPIDEDTFHVMCAAFLANAVVGGKRATGHGRLRALVGNEIAIARPAEAMHAIDTTALAPGMGQLFRSHVAARADRLRSFLRTVDA